jgi:hypothetical protein
MENRKVDLKRFGLWDSKRVLSDYEIKYIDVFMVDLWNDDYMTFSKMNFDKDLIEEFSKK